MYSCESFLVVSICTNCSLACYFAFLCTRRPLVGRKKISVYSFGVVLLELLTGSPPFGPMQEIEEWTEQIDSLVCVMYSNRLVFGIHSFIWPHFFFTCDYMFLITRQIDVQHLCTRLSMQNLKKTTLPGQLKG